MVEHEPLAIYHLSVTQPFCRWYELGRASDEAPEQPGVFQLRVKNGLIDYPGGKSAMVHYQGAENIKTAVLMHRNQGSEALLCRHTVTDTYSDAEALFQTLQTQFIRRFTVPPSYRGVDSGT